MKDSVCTGAQILLHPLSFNAPLTISPHQGKAFEELMFYLDLLLEGISEEKHEPGLP